MVRSWPSPELAAFSLEAAVALPKFSIAGWPNPVFGSRSQHGSVVTGPRNILVGVSDSIIAPLVLESAVDLARNSAARLTLLHVLEANTLACLGAAPVSCRGRQTRQGIDCWHRLSSAYLKISQPQASCVRAQLRRRFSGARERPTTTQLSSARAGALV